jgi:tripartite-type tricarboxylate transporter receptor subunit TctC
MSRRTAVGAMVALTASPALRARPGKQLRIIVPFPAGGTADALPRIVGEKIRAAYPGGVIVENKSGAGGNIGAELVFRSEPDGETLLASPPGPIAINQALYPKLAFDPTKWVPVTVLATVPNVLAVGPSVTAAGFAQLLAGIKANPGKFSYASQGNGSTSHLTTHMFMSLTNTDMVHVPYKGTAPALVDLMGGQVDMLFDNLASSMQHHQAGKLRILAVADEQRTSVLPDVPTFAELGLQGMNAVTWFAVMAPPGTPDALVRVSYQPLADALRLPDVRKQFSAQGAQARGWSPEETARFVRAESDKWGRLVKRANVTVE